MGAPLPSENAPSSPFRPRRAPIPNVPVAVPTLSLPRALAVTGVSHRYGVVQALRDVSLSVPAGHALALVGESGSGKTTLLRCVNRMVQPDAGTVCIGDVDVTAIPLETLRRGIGYVPQDGGLMPHWRVLRNVAFVPTLLGSDDPHRAAQQAMDIVGLSVRDFGGRYPHELSGGQRQRVAIARALAAKPGLLLMDEPFGAVDAITRADLQAAFEIVRRTQPVTTVLVTHDLAEAARLADLIGVMRNGAIEQLASTHTVLRTPATEYVADLFQRLSVSMRALEIAR